MIVIEDTAVNAGVSTTVRVLIGTIKTDSLVATSVNPTSFRFSQSGVSQDVRIFLNGIEQTISERVLDLISEVWAVQSNVLSSVDVMYLNLDTFSNRFNIGDTVRLDWVELKNTSFETTDVKFDFGTLTSLIVESFYKDSESTESIKINAPVFNETQFIIRGRDDYMKAFKLLNTDIADTNYVDVSPAVVELCYVQSDSCLFTDVQLSQYVTQLSTFRPMGLQPPTIGHPTISFLDVDVTMQLLNGSGDPSSEVETIMSGEEHVLKHSFDFADIENKIESLSFVKIARVVLNSTEWDSDTYYNIGKHVSPNPVNGFLYVMDDIVYKSGATEPTWPNSLPLGQQVIDGRLFWCLID